MKNVEEKLDTISPSFCVAKWKQVSMHLQNGMNHSCHHPPTHVVPISEIKSNFTALHNSEYKKQQRKLMLEGFRPKECDYCWRIEDNGKGLYSDRIYKSASEWSYSYIDEIANKRWDDNIDPSYVEVSFSNVCNFKCSYCAPHISSKWMEEIEKYGPYPTTDRYNNLDWLRSKNMLPIPNREENVYVDAFWAWFPTMYKNLQRLRITGGEPLLSKDTFKLLDNIIENPNTDLELGVNSNLNPPQELLDKFIEKIKIIVDQQKVKKLILFTSAEAHGKQAEYIRYGMNYEQWLKNINRIFEEVPNIQFTIMSTYNILSLPSYISFLNDVLVLKRKWGKINKIAMLLDIPYLRHPEHQSVFIMEPEMANYIHEQIEFMKKNVADNSNFGFYAMEIDKLQRIYNLTQNDNDNKNLDLHRKNFVRFVDEHDKRRDTNFLNTFPELNSMYNKWAT